MNAGAESLQAHGAALGVIGDNLANASTPGFKSGRAEFFDVMSGGDGSKSSFNDPGSSGMTAGNGAQVTDVSTTQTQGSIDFTNRDRDLAINGKGFFILNDGTNTFYTRAGNFGQNFDGNLTAITGENVMGFTPESPDTLTTIRIDGVGDLVVSDQKAFQGNLNASAEIIDAADIPANPATFNELNEFSDFVGFTDAVDGIGEVHDITVHFFRTGLLTWTANAYVDSTEVGAGAAGTPSLIGTSQITFDGRGQALNNPTAEWTAAWNNGADPTTVTVDFSNMTGFAVESNISGITGNGTAPGNLIGIEVSTDGTINAKLDNGELTILGTLALADFNNPSRLRRVGSNRFEISDSSGDPEVGQAGTESRGLITHQALELSNVDPSVEFVNLIRFQRGYQAGSQVISTISELLNGTIQVA